MSDPVVQLAGVSKTHKVPSGPLAALDDVSLEVGRGQFVVIQGPSGSGKSTLLLTVGGMQRPSQGSVVVAGVDLYSLSSRQRSQFRAEQIGFVFQLFHLLPYLNVLDNVALGGGKDRTRAGELLEQFGLADRRLQQPTTLSAGERQRVALARALMGGPALILADEPTGNLDPENSKIVLNCLAEFCRDGGTVLMVTHGSEASALANRQYVLTKGRLEESGSLA